MNEAETDVLLMIDSQHRDRLAEVCSAVAALGATILGSQPILGIVYVRIRRSQIDRLRSLPDVVSVEESRMLGPL